MNAALDEAETRLIIAHGPHILFRRLRGVLAEWSRA